MLQIHRFTKSTHIEQGNGSFSTGEIHPKRVQTKSTHIVNASLYSTGEIHHNIIQTNSHQTERFQNLNLTTRMTGQRLRITNILI